MSEITAQLLKTQLQRLPLSDSVTIPVELFREILRLNAIACPGPISLHMRPTDRGVNIPTLQLRDLLNTALLAKEWESSDSPYVP